MMLEINKKSASMRRVVGMMLPKMAEEDPRFIFATADVARYFGVTEFQEKYPQRYVDVGIAEQNLIGVAAGMQKEGAHVFAATYATFITARALDQVRVNLGYMGLGVKLIGVGGGMAEGDLSPTHMGLEDIADMRAIPKVAVICPADGVETIKALDALLHYEGPAYLRLTGRTNLPIVYTEDYNFEIGKSVCLRDGTDIGIIATGCIVGTACKVARELEKQGISCRVVNMHTIKPLDTEELDRLAGYKMIISIEEHMPAGGLGGAIAEYYTGKSIRPVHIVFSIGDEYPKAGEYEHLLEKCGLTDETILNVTLEQYRNLS